MSFELDGPCAAMWRGQQPAGAICGLDVEYFVCAPDAECVLGLEFCGACRSVMAEGQACSPGTDTCDSDAFCDAGTCRARVRNEEACGAADRCLTGTVCDGGTCTLPTCVARGEACNQRRRCPYLTACVSGSCQPTADEGEACTRDAACEVGYCDAAGACRPPRATAELCDRASECASGLCDRVSCSARPSACVIGS